MRLGGPATDRCKSVLESHKLAYASNQGSLSWESCVVLLFKNFGVKSVAKNHYRANLLSIVIKDLGSLYIIRLLITLSNLAYSSFFQLLISISMKLCKLKAC